MRIAFCLLTILAGAGLTGCTTTEPISQPVPAGGLSGGLAGTTWIGQSPDGGTMHCEFHAGGRLVLSAAEGTWQQHESTVTMAVGNGYATYRGTVSGTTMSGTAHNQTGKTWGWSVTKAP
jgi:hypothetical protein